MGHVLSGSLLLDTEILACQSPVSHTFANQFHCLKLVIAGVVMRVLKFAMLLASVVCWSISCIAAGAQKTSAASGQRMAPVKIVPDEANRKVDVLVNGQPFTSYIYPTTLKKPVLFPLRTATGVVVTRGFPPLP